MNLKFIKKKYNNARIYKNPLEQHLNDNIKKPVFKSCLYPYNLAPN
jgi:hypothetical protein